jgi:O-antigen ligase
MDFTDSQYAQLILAMACGILLFAMVYRIPERATLAILILLIPFQVIDSRYGSVNMLLIYLISFSFLLQGRLRQLPFLGPILLVLFSMVLSFTQVHPLVRMTNILYLIGFFSNILIFYLIYNFVLRTKDWNFIIKCLVALNILIVIYCAIQFVAGSQTVSLFGIRELSMNPIRADGRLVGPFKATAITAEYLSVQCVLLAYLLTRRPGPGERATFIGLIAMNSLFLIATGNRGGFITLVFGGLLFLYFFRRQLGLARVTKMLVAGSTIVTIVALLVINYTQYDMLFDRLSDTEVEGGVPDTRARAWPLAWERFQQAPILGHGPQLAIGTTQERAIAELATMIYPHNLILHVLYTTGLLGLIAWFVFFWQLVRRLLVAKSFEPEDGGGVIRMGLVMICVVFVSQLRIEFLRDGVLDYQNFLFALFALLLACSDLIVSAVRKEVQSRPFGKPVQESTV